ncbi:hypothetical protein TL16_g12975 [Triparma laevis f. inornata]|uniref:Phospholipid/glycerol acyltransferase domain-containing protein n=1 Tax=Triparma laevis f. inornata TaxID=1714386 RepID=A0A9W7BQL4_9STRA|nr:hypothetical protein TL16_g12975 [Triparma laevis f. inornata]
MDAFFINLFHENVVTLTKVEFLLIPFFGVLAFVSPAVFIDRKDFRSGRRSLEVCGERVKEGGVVFVSPEGESFGGGGCKKMMIYLRGTKTI